MFVKDNFVNIKGSGYDWIYLYSEKSNPVKLIEKDGCVPFIGHGIYIASKGKENHLLNTFGVEIDKLPIAVNNKIKKESQVEFKLSDLSKENKKKIGSLISQSNFKELIQYVNNNNLGSYKLCCDHSLIVKEYGKVI